MAELSKTTPDAAAEVQRFVSQTTSTADQKVKASQFMEDQALKNIENSGNTVAVNAPDNRQTINNVSNVTQNSPKPTVRNTDPSFIGTARGLVGAY